MKEILKNIKKGNKGITLIALIVTIIVLIILAGVTLNLLMGENGILTRAKGAKEINNYSAAIDQINLKLMEIQMKYASENKDYTLVEIANEMEQSQEETIEAYYNEQTALIKDGVTKNLVKLKGIAVVANEYPKYKFYIGKTLQVEKVTTKENPTEEDFEDINSVQNNSSNNTTNTPQIEDAKTKYTVILNANGGNFTDNSSTKQIQVEEGQTLTLPKVTKTEEYFYNWTDEEENTYTQNQILTINKNITLTANWVQEIQGESLLDVIGSYSFENDTVYTVSANNKQYSLHIYNINGDKEVTTTEVYGDSGDVATIEDQTAKNMVVLKVNGNLNVSSTGKITAYADEDGYGGPKGMLIYCTGTLTNNGEITMTARGARAEGEDVYLYKGENGTVQIVPAEGANGGGRAYVGGEGTTRGTNGTNGTERQTGGGGSGSANYGDCNTSTYSGAGAKGTSYSGGSGGGAASANNYSSNYGNSAEDNGGAGGNGYGNRYSSDWASRSAGGGAGNPGGYSDENGGGTGNVTTTRGENGTGGLLIIYSNNFENNGSILSNGSKGAYYGRGTGGSSGGGSINIFSNNIENIGTINADGGDAEDNGSGSYVGSKGGNGTVSIGNISSGNYVPEN